MAQLLRWRTQVEQIIRWPSTGCQIRFQVHERVITVLFQPAQFFFCSFLFKSPNGASIFCPTVMHFIVLSASPNWKITIWITGLPPWEHESCINNGTCYWLSSLFHPLLICFWPQPLFSPTHTALFLGRFLVPTKHYLTTRCPLRHSNHLTSIAHTPVPICPSSPISPLPPSHIPNAFTGLAPSLFLFLGSVCPCPPASQLVCVFGGFCHHHHFLHGTQWTYTWVCIIQCFVHLNHERQCHAFQKVIKELLNLYYLW